MSLAEQLLSLLESGASHEKIFAVSAMVGRKPGEPLLLRRLALVRSFDEELFRLLSSDLETRPFGEFVKQQGVVSSPSGSYFIDDSNRTDLLADWHNDPSLPEVADRILDFFKQRNSPVDIATALLFTNPTKALEEFEKLYREADQQFDLPQCGQLIQILRARNALLTLELRAAWQAKEAYLNSRVMFADDYYRTAAFYERKALTKAFQDFWSAPDQWFLELHGKGGFGKTMFLRWLIARQCIPRIEGNTIPVARLDFDSLDLAAFASWPWLVLLPIAQQLATQLNPNPFLSLILELEEFGAILQRARTVGDRSFDHLLLLLTAKADSTPISFQSSLGQREVLIVLDTCEEPLLHRQPALRKLIDMLASIRLTPLTAHQAPCQGMRVIVSGRYRVTERMPDLRRKYRAGMAEPVKIEPFTEDEAKAYLQERRGMDDQALVSAIMAKSKGNPFLLSLFADLQSAGLTPKDVRMAPSTDVNYLVERVILRIQRVSVRWLVRYAVIAPVLTFDFVKNVLSRFLPGEASGRTGRDNPDVGISIDTYTWRKPWPKTRIGELKTIWDDLCRYASDQSWISVSNNVITLQPEVVEPMRTLLRKNDGIYFPLHQAAEKYFRRTAKADPAHWAAHMAAALFHRFQSEGSVAGEEWRRLLDDPRAQTALARSEFAGLILSSAFLDDRGRPRKDHQLGWLVDDVTLARACFEAAFASLVQRLHSGRIEDPRVSNMENLVRYREQLSAVPEEPRKKAVPYRRLRLLDAAVAIYNGDEAQGLQILKGCLASERDASFLLVGHVLAARASEYSSVRVAENHLNRAVLLSHETQSVDFPLHWINFRFAALYRRNGGLLKSGEALENSLNAILDSGIAEEHAPEVFWRLSGILRQLGKWSELSGAIQRTRHAISSPAWTHSQIHFQIGLAKARLALDQYDPLRALGLLEKIKPLRTNYETRGAWAEASADCAAQLLDAPAAIDAFNTAAFEFRSLGSVVGPALARIGEAKFNLIQLGDYKKANIRPIRLKSWKVEFEEASFRLHLKPSRIERADWRSYFTDASAPEAVGVRLLSQILALRSGKPTRDEGGIQMGDLLPADSFLNSLQRVEPIEARYRGLEGFSTSLNSLAPDPGLIPRLQACTPTPASKDPDFILKALALADARRFFGDSTGAIELLHRVDRRAGDNVFLRRRVYQAIRRVENAELPLTSYLASFEKRFSHYPHLVAAAAVEAAQWSLNVKDSRDTERFLQVAAKYFKASPADSIWRVNYHLLRGEVEELHNRPTEASQEYNDAVNMAVRLGNKHAEKLALAKLEFASQTGDRVALADVSLKQDYLTATISPTGLSGHFVGSHFAVYPHTLFPQSFLTDLAYEPAAMPGLLQQALRLFSIADFEATTVRLRIPRGPLAALPWELAFAPPSSPHFIFRGSAQEPVTETVRYMQLVLRAGGKGKAVDGNPRDPVLQRTIRRIESGQNAHEYFRRLALSSDQKVEPSVLLLEPNSPEQRQSDHPHVVAGVDLKNIYRRNGVLCHTLPYSEPEQIFDAILQRRPTAVHLSTGFLETPHEGVAADFAGRSSKGPPLTPERFASKMRELPADYLRPLVIVEGLLPQDRYNGAHQALLRNAFCADLREAVGNRGVLATGLYSHIDLAAFLNGLAAALAKQPTLAELTNQLWSMPGSFIPPALWTADPRLPAFS